MSRPRGDRNGSNRGGTDRGNHRSGPGRGSRNDPKVRDKAQKMLDFKSGKKPATLMHQITKGYSDEQLQQLAAYFAALKK